MITELIMLFSVSIFIWAGLKVYKNYKTVKRNDLLFLSIFFLGAGIGVLFYTFRMIFVQSEFLDILFYKIGGVFHETGLLSAMLFGFLMFQPKWYKKLLGFLIIFIITVGSFWMLGVNLKVENIPLEPYEPWVVKRTEIIYVGEQMVLLALVIFVPMLAPIITFVLYGLKNKSKQSWLFASGFAIHAIAFSMDAMAPWPALLFLWRLLYGISAFVIYKAFSY